MYEFKLPAIGEGVVEGEIVRWLKQPGEPVAANEAIVEVMTDKATVEIPAPQAGVVQEHRAPEGAIAEVGQVIAILSVGGSANAPAPRTPVATPSTPTPTVPAAMQETTSSTFPPAGLPKTPSKPANGTSTSSSTGPVLATPAARALARQSGIDLTTVASDRGRITKDHVAAAAASPPSQRASATTAVEARPEAPASRPTPRLVRDDAGPTEERLPFRGMRRRIAEGMVKSYTTAVHYTYVEQVNVTKLVAVREQAKAAAAAEGVSLSYLPFIVKAVLRALKKFPIVNAELDEQAQEIIVKKHYSIGIATATDQGLMVPVLHQADRLSLLDIAGEIARLSEAARKFKASREELTGSTFTITSLGTIGGVLATPILNYPEVGILGVHAIRKTPIVDENDQIVIGHLMNLSVSLDHRVVDGFEGASFLQEVKRYLEDPTLLLLAGV